LEVVVRSVIFLEFNELSPRLMSRFIQEGQLPNFERLYRESEAYITETAEEPPALEPWIQWVNVHCGLDYSEHGIFSLNEGHKLKQKNVWDLLSDAGYRVLVFGSMNIRYDVPINGVLVPDPWTTDTLPHPPELLPYFRFVQKNVTEYTSERVPLSAADYAGFMAFMAAHGLSGETVLAVLRQLASERSGRARWKRAAILDLLQFDVFSWYYRRQRPHFSTFFLNSTAHFQHLYWRNLEPEAFAVQPPPEEQAELGTAVLFGYQQMDRLVGRFYQLVGDEATLVLCTALSQQPCLKYEETGGKVVYRPRDFQKLLDFAGVSPRRRVSPVMAEEFHVYFEAAEDLASAERLLGALRVGERPAMRARRHEGGLLLGCQIFEPLGPGERLRRAGSEDALPFFDVFYQIEGVKSGMHHPDGLLWVRTPERRHVRVDGKIPLNAIAPTVLDWFKVPRPEFMKGVPLGALPAARTA
jgi:hypothetical protein